MQSAVVYDESKQALNKRLEAIGWGLFLMIIGALWLVPDQRVPDGTWLIAAGVIMLGVNGVRYLNGIRMSRASLLLGLLALLFGIGEFVGLELPFVAILLIVFGVGIILRPWIDPLLEPKQT
ncbi:MAG TPA: hypothetical protein VFT99_03265 [Roseiflexaceae bacterium]|nr:hypothetical protein [Roseiflexaceae bacterium]